MVMYNGRPAFLAGNLAALAGMTLGYVGLLPSPCAVTDLDGAIYEFGPWGFTFGSLAALLVFLTWRPWSTVFLDRVCIHQSDYKRKVAGILSLGGILKHSKRLLVLLDPTYPTRLWTMFEIAAFLKSHNSSRELVIRPTILGPTALGLSLFVFQLCLWFVAVMNGAGLQSLLIQAGCSWPFYVFITHMLRQYFAWVEEFTRQLGSFTVADAQTECCTANHVDARGSGIPCDREIILECLRAWFGSVEAFEHCVRGRVAAALTEGLGLYAFPTSWFLGHSWATMYMLQGT